MCFHDVTSLDAGELWEEHILQALRNSAVFVAMYTPNYFAHIRGKRCFCGREFAAFRSRSDNSTQIPRQTNIVAVKWVVPRYDRDNFPPPCVRRNKPCAQRAISLPFRLLMKISAWSGCGTRDPRRRKYVRDAIVDQILRLARTPPVALPDLPDMDAVPCAFHDEIVEAADFPEASPSTITTGGPGRLVLIYAVSGSAVPDDGAFRVQQTAFSKR